MKPSDILRLRKTAIQLSMRTQTGLDYLLGALSVSDLLDLIKEVGEVVSDDRKRVQARGQNSRYR